MLTAEQACCGEEPAAGVEAALNPLPCLQPGSEACLDGWGHVGAPESLQLPLSLQQGAGSCHQKEPSWDGGVEGGETDEQRMKKEAGFKEGGRYKKGRHETTP